MTAAEPALRVRRNRRRLIFWVLGVVAVALLALTAWIGVRALMAKSELESAIPLAGQLKEDVATQNTERIPRSAEQLREHAAKAASLTDDPIWRVAEAVPGVGPNLSAVRQLAAVFHSLSSDAVTPLVELASDIGVESFKPVGGAFQVQPLIDARPDIDAAARAVDAAQASLAQIDTDATIGAVRAAKQRVVDQLAQLAVPVHAIRTATVLLPGMLGASEARNYLLLFQNPAELRASGGIPGALALLKTEAGRIDLVQQASAADFGRFDKPVLSLTSETRGLYGNITGQYMQNVNLTPQFPLSAALAKEMWRQKFGVDVDGVLSIDPVALGYVLQATGPITLTTGDVLTAENAATLLLRDAYVRYNNPEYQDVFFAAAASAVFNKVADGELDGVKLVEALAKAGNERRIYIWSAVEAEQAEVTKTTLAGALRTKTNETQPFGVYFNDATASKMDFYLDVEVAGGQVTCRGDERPHFGVAVTLTNAAPADAAATFPDYVTGAGAFGVSPGNIKTLVSVYGTPELQNLGVTRDGTTTPYLPATDSGYQVSQIAIELAPGESTTMQFGFLGEAPFEGALVIDQTPVINLHETKKLALSCESPLW